MLLEPAPANWARAYQRLALENPIIRRTIRPGRAAERRSAASLSITGLGRGRSRWSQLWSAWQRGDWAQVALTIVGLLGAAGLGWPPTCALDGGSCTIRSWSRKS